ncbi:unnamed protein product [Durusdinium trenchii]|uniref:Amino acid transporter transmembrane domain-containing protein n=1 Tax=Durusdinium trenchii TaxID=1381693 RepID=A0ABP0PUR4_9DINO
MRSWSEPDDDGSDLASSDGSASDVDTSDDEDFSGVPLVAISFNITKGIVGIGILSLPAGVAEGTGLIPAMIILVLMYLAMLYTFWSLGRCCEATHCKTHGGIAFALRKSHVFGSIMEITNITGTIFGCAGYAIVIGKSSQGLWQSIGVEDGWYASARGSFVIILCFILLPLCLLRDLSKLAFTSFIGVACELFVVFFMVCRYFGGDYHPGGQFYDPKNSASSTGIELFTIDSSVFFLVGSCVNAFVAHWNSPKFYHQLRNRGTRRFLIAVSLGFSMALVLYLVCMAVGYLTFGAHCHGDILHNYSAHDDLASISRVAMLFATIFGFPINFTGILGCTFTDLGLLSALVGGSVGALVTLVYPGLMMMWTYSNRKDPYIKGVFRAIEGRPLACALIAFGCAMAVVGTYQVIRKRLTTSHSSE